MKFTADQNRAVYNNVYPHVQAYLAARLPVWTAATDPVLGPFWTTVSAGNIAGLNSSPQQWLAGRWTRRAWTPKYPAGPRLPGSLEYHFTYLTNYQFVGGALKGWGAGTALRYETPAAIGYLGGPARSGRAWRDRHPAGLQPGPRQGGPAPGSLAVLSVETPVPGRPDSCDHQLNCRDLWSNGSLLTVGINPDGSAQAFRIIPPRQWYLQTGFDF